jgi:hypothetical protein
MISRNNKWTGRKILAIRFSKSIPEDAVIISEPIEDAIRSRNQVAVYIPARPNDLIFLWWLKTERLRITKSLPLRFSRLISEMVEP